MKSVATLNVVTPFLLAPVAKPTTRRRTRTTRPVAAMTPGLFARLDRETAVDSLPETVVFGLLGVTGAAWPAWEALRLIFAF